MFGKKNQGNENRFGSKNISTAYSFGSKNDNHNKPTQYHQQEEKKVHNDLERMNNNTQNHQMKILNRI